jgi:hypothetical protein
MFATANTVSRLVIGPIADSISPVVSDARDGRSRVGRVYIMSATVLLLFSIFVWMDVGVRSQEALWVLRYNLQLLVELTLMDISSVLELARFMG